jgi:hypothetical protein
VIVNFVDICRVDAVLASNTSNPGNSLKGKRPRVANWAYLGTSIMSAALFAKNKWCGWSELSNSKIFKCKSGLTVLPGALGVHPFGEIGLIKGLMTSNFKVISRERAEALLKVSFGLHLFNSATKRTRILTNDGSLIGEVLKKNCPVTSEVAGDEL